MMESKSGSLLRSGKALPTDNEKERGWNCHIFATVVHSFPTKCWCINHHPSTTMQRTVKMEERTVSCYLATLVFYLVIQGGLIFPFSFFKQFIPLHLDSLFTICFYPQTADRCDVISKTRQPKYRADSTAEDTHQDCKLLCMLWHTYKSWSLHLKVEMGINPCNSRQG